MAVCAHPVVLTAQIAAPSVSASLFSSSWAAPSSQCSAPTRRTINQVGVFRELHICGVTVTLNRKFTGDFEIRAGYVHSKTIDDGSFDWPP
jgi:hypothetical protein